jgi:hypothetical protein
MDAMSDVFGVGKTQYPYIDDGFALRGDHVGRNTAFYHPYVDGNASLWVIQRKKVLDLMGQFHYGARSFPRIETGMGCPPLHEEGETAQAFAGCLQLPLQAQRRFQDIGSLCNLGQTTDSRRRFPAPNLLVGVDQSYGTECRLQVQIPDRLQGKRHLGQPGLHIENAGAFHLLPGLFERHFLDSPDFPDSIAVTDHQLQRLFPASLRGTGKKVTARLFSGHVHSVIS